MKLKKLTLSNYGLYRGVTSFDLAPRHQYGKLRPVVLFGGQNGAGKTTLFDAFRVVLYGKTALGDRVTDAEYKSFLRNRIHRSASERIHVRSAYIELEFEHVPLGTPVSYVVRRFWEEKNGSNIAEYLSITEDGRKLCNVSHEYWQGFVEEIIPERLSSLFFFDGEKIKSIADDENGNAALAESIKTLLGIDIVERLHSDLSIYKTREALKCSTNDFQEDVARIKNEIDNCEKNVELIAEKLASNMNHIDSVDKELRAVEQRLKQEGYAFSLERESLIASKARFEKALEGLQALLRAEYEGVYPFSLCPQLSQKLKNQINKEQKHYKESIVREELNSLKARLKVGLSGVVELDGELCSVVERIVENELDERLGELLPPEGYVEVHGFSPLEASEVCFWLDKAENRSRQTVDDLQRQIEDVTRKLQRVQQELQKAPSEEVLRPFVEKQNILNQEKGRLAQDRERLESQDRVVRSKIAELSRSLDKVLAKYKANDDAGARVIQSAKIQKVIGSYADKLTCAKIEELRSTVAGCFNRLSRKGDMIKSIHIDPKTFAVTLQDRFGNRLLKEELSAGEKQMYAVAMLWGLSLTSGRPLPVIIDTPLGRLDSVHRRNLVSHYFPKAAEQVIILSTDTEIDQTWYSELAPYLSHSYQLCSVPEENRSEVRVGYFWGGE